METELSGEGESQGPFRLEGPSGESGCSALDSLWGALFLLGSRKLSSLLERSLAGFWAVSAKSFCPPAGILGSRERAHDPSSPIFLYPST